MLGREQPNQLNQLNGNPKLLDSISDNNLPQQDWSSLAPDVNQDYILISKLPPWKVAIDFSKLEASDTILIQIHLRLFGPDESQVQWVLSDEHTVSIHNEPDKTFLQVNGQPVSRGRLLLLSPIEGPLLARLTYRQILGWNKDIRLLMLQGVPE